MRLLGIDYGTKRVGVALSNPEREFAQPYKVVANTKTLIADIAAIIIKEGVTGVVIGESKNFKGQDNEIMPKIRQFATDIAQVAQVPVHLEPEFLSSHQAQYFQGHHPLLDASAAAIILQSYLDKIKK